MSVADNQIAEKTKHVVKEPARWKVIFLNDDVTPMDFVVGALMDTFKHTAESANSITLQVHNEGSGVAGVYSFEIAEAKSVEVTQMARANNFPLAIKLEEE